jgi:hypothetical protein
MAPPTLKSGIQLSPNCPSGGDTSKGRFEPKRGHFGDTPDTFLGFLSRARIREEIGKRCPYCPYCPLEEHGLISNHNPAHLPVLASFAFPGGVPW